MPQWIFWSILARAQIRALDRVHAKKILDAIAGLRAENANIKPVKGYEPLLRLRVGDFRVLYYPLREERFDIVRVARRRDAYRELESLRRR